LKEHPVAVWQRYEEMVIDRTSATRRLAVGLELAASDALISSVSDRWAVERTEKKTSRVLCRRRRRRLLHRGLKRLRLAGPTTRAIRRFRPRFAWDPDVDERTLLRADHVSATRGAAGAWREGLAGAEADTILKRYESWFTDAGYRPESTDPAGGK
jgi:hypothetical protein